MMRLAILVVAMAAIVGSTLGFQVAPRGALVGGRTRLQHQDIVSLSATRMSWTRRKARPSLRVNMQLGPPGENERGTMPSYEEEQEREYFQSNLDKASTAEKLKDPVALIFLGWIVGMFGITIFLILNGGV